MSQEVREQKRSESEIRAAFRSLCQSADYVIDPMSDLDRQIVAAALLELFEFRRDGISVPSVPALVGIGEIADMLSVTKQRVHQLSLTPRFPAPVARLRATQVWRRADIETFNHGRRQWNTKSSESPEPSR